MEESMLLKSMDEAPVALDNTSLFCHLMVEEFLMKKGMGDTLTAFREEWKSKPDEVPRLAFFICYQFNHASWNNISFICRWRWDSTGLTSH